MRAGASFGSSIMCLRDPLQKNLELETPTMHRNCLTFQLVVVLLRHGECPAGDVDRAVEAPIIGLSKGCIDSHGGGIREKSSESVGVVVREHGLLRNGFGDGLEGIVF